MLLLGGFTIASALSKHDIAKRMATFVLSKAGTKPKVILLVIMAVSAFASMFISNVAAPVLMFAIIEPILRNLEKDSEYARALILGIALASNVGGMLSPIASPQNIIAMGIMQPEPGWSVWFLITIPVGIISIILIWCLLFLSFKFDVKRIAPIKPVRDSFSATQWFISIVTVATILLWCVESKLDYIFGEMGVIAIIPIILFYGTGLLTDDDFNTQKWSIIILAAGGLALGKAVNSSGLLHVIANGIASEVSGWGLYWVFVTFAGLILVMASFISHTVTAIIILPLVFTVGTGMEDPRPNLLVMGSAMMCSVAMALATSGFPNMSKSFSCTTSV
jgi:phosphate transporter